MEAEPPKPSNYRQHRGNQPPNHHRRERHGLGIPSNGTHLHSRPHEQSRITTSSASDFVLQWGNRKRLRCMKMNKSNRVESSSPVRKSTAAWLDPKSINDDKDRFDFNHHGGGGDGYFNLRHRNNSPPTSKRVLRSSEIMRVKNNDGGGGGDNKAAVVSQDKKNHHHHVGGGGGSSDHDNKIRGGGGCSSGSDAVPPVWPLKFVIALTNKEKEEDFMAIKGSKLPQRPKKRAKLIQRTLNAVSPGTWLCDLTLDRYEVREKKTSKKRPRGLKAMGNMDSDSDS